MIQAQPPHVSRPLHHRKMGQLAVVLLSVVAIWSAIIGVIAAETWPRGRELAEALKSRRGQPEFDLASVAAFEWDKFCLNYPFLWGPRPFSDDQSIREYVFLKNDQVVQVVEASRFDLLTNEHVAFDFPCFGRAAKARVTCYPPKSVNCSMDIKGPRVGRGGYQGRQ